MPSPINNCELKGKILGCIDLVNRCQRDQALLNMAHEEIEPFPKGYKEQIDRVSLLIECFESRTTEALAELESALSSILDSL